MADSEKQDKQIWHRRWRSKIRQLLHMIEADDDVMLPNEKDVSDPWDMAKDGKQRYQPRGFNWYK
jgi:hypothetical protein